MKLSIIGEKKTKCFRIILRRKKGSSSFLNGTRTKPGRKIQIPKLAKVRRYYVCHKGG